LPFSQKETEAVDLYLIRHADALRLGERGITRDPDRPLSEQGMGQAKALGLALPRRNVKLDLVLTSPLLRARQTAEEMLRHWSLPAPELRVAEELQPDGKPKRLARFLRGLDAPAVALVGHQPDLSRYVGWLVRGKKAQIDLAKAGVAAITFPGKPFKKAGTLVWLVTPEWLGEPAASPVGSSVT
jgi:phosphohistidine phosphatase